ncbi:MAG: FtsX-like permease family protein [Ginsengibacter sp.]
MFRDFNFRSLHEQIQPIIVEFIEKSGNGNIPIRAEPGKTRQAIASLQTICRQFNPGFPFTYFFADQEYQKLYRNEEVTDKLSNAFATLAIFISCLCLLGLVIFTAKQRTKEIGIRKVLGASVRGIIQ